MRLVDGRPSPSYKGLASDHLARVVHQPAVDRLGGNMFMASRRTIKIRDGLVSRPPRSLPGAEIAAEYITGIKIADPQSPHERIPTAGKARCRWACR
jgi:hypothetical protein